MDPKIKQRYNFALSAFSRMHGVDKINFSMKEYCKMWSQMEVDVPLENLNDVDQYFYYEYRNWKFGGLTDG